MLTLEVEGEGVKDEAPSVAPQQDELTNTIEQLRAEYREIGQNPDDLTLKRMAARKLEKRS
jgi:hypothetical protein